MTAQRIIQKPVDGRLIIDVPKEFQNETLLITFEPTKETENLNPFKNIYLKDDSKLEVAQTFFDGLKKRKIDFETDEYNVYEQ